MTLTAETLMRRWIERFGEPPALIDEELMRRLLAEYGDGNGQAKTR